MMMFYFVSVQMFNSIINYSYNTSREEMEPLFEKEKVEAKARALLNAGKPSVFQRLYLTLRPKKKRQQAKEKKSHVREGHDHGHVVEAISDHKVRERVEEWRKLQKEKRSGDSTLSVFLFISFAVMYISFLELNLYVELNYEMRTRVTEAITKSTVSLVRADGGSEKQGFQEASSMAEMDAWLSTLPTLLDSFAGSAIPEERNRIRLEDIAFGADPVRAGQLTDELVEWVEANGTVVPSFVYCISSWNCLVNKGGSLLRLTMTSVPLQENTGTTNISALVPLTGVAQGATWWADDAQELQSVWRPAEQKWSPKFAVTLATQALLVEFITYNGNADMLAHTKIAVDFSPAGTIDQRVRTIAFKFPHYFEDGWEFLRLFPVFWYGLMVFYYSVLEAKELYVEYVKRAAHLTDDAPLVVRLHLAAVVGWHHFADDIYNVLDMSSIVISITSIVLFLMFTLQTYAFEANLDDASWGYDAFLAWLDDVTGSMTLYVQLSSINLLVVSARLLKFLRENPRMNKLTATLVAAAKDMAWFTTMLFIVMVGFVTFGYVSFGPKVKGLSDLGMAVRYCFEMIVGKFDYWELYAVDPLMASSFFYIYVIIFNCIFVNIFFAIIDCFYVTATPPPLNWKRMLKPYLGNMPLLRSAIQWDDDLQMEVDGGGKESGPPARTEAAKNTRTKIEDMREEAARRWGGTRKEVNCRLVNDEKLGGSDEKLNEVVSWCKDEARKFIEKFAKFKEEKTTFASEASFIEKKRKELGRWLREEEKALLESERVMKYNLVLGESAANQDLDTACRYMLLLEHKIARKSGLLQQLNNEMEFLRSEVDRLQFTEEEIEMRSRDTAGGFREFGHEEHAEEGDIVLEHPDEARGQLSHKPPEPEPDGVAPSAQSAMRERQREDFLKQQEEVHV